MADEGAVIVPGESRFRWRLAVLSLVAFSLLFGLKILTDDEPIKALDLLGDGLQIALLVATAVTAAVLATRMRTQHEEQLDLMRDLAQARTEGEAWRREARSYLAGLGTAHDQCPDPGFRRADSRHGVD